MPPKNRKKKKAKAVKKVSKPIATPTASADPKSDQLPGSHLATTEPANPGPIATPRPTANPKSDEPLQPSITTTTTEPFWKKIPKTIYAGFLFLLSCLALIAFIPRISVVPASPGRYMAPRFTVSNDGSFKITDVTAACFLWRVTFDSNGHSDNNITQFSSPPQKILDPTDGYTVPCALTAMPSNSRFSQVDIAIVTFYRPWPFTFFCSRKLARFVARQTPGDKDIIWDKQPSAELEKDFNETLKRVGENYKHFGLNLPYGCGK